MLRTAIFMQINEIENLDERRIDLRSELIFNPDNPTVLNELGAILCFQKKTDDAIEVYRKVLELEPGDAEHMAYMGYLYYEKEDFEKAIELLNMALDIDPEAPFVQFLLGNSYSRVGKIVEAIHSYDLAIFLDFDIYLAHIQFAVKYERMGRYKRSLREYVAAYEIDPREEELKEKIDKLSEILKNASLYNEAEHLNFKKKS